MARNIDLTALRSFVTVAETGGVTRAAGQLHLTQSAVSMQLKRLEEFLGQSLLDRSGRGVALTAQGEQLLSYGKRMLDLNDEVWARMNNQDFEGEVHLGVPHDIVHPHIPRVLQRFAAEFPRMKVQLCSSFTKILKEELGRGELDLILTTEVETDAGGETMEMTPLVWIGAPSGNAYRARPIRLAFLTHCMFRRYTQAALDDAGIVWESGVQTDSDSTIDATISADLAIAARLLSAARPYHDVIEAGSGLPALPMFKVNMYQGKSSAGVVDYLADLIRSVYGHRRAMAAE